MVYLIGKWSKIGTKYDSAEFFEVLRVEITRPMSLRPGEKIVYEVFPGTGFEQWKEIDVPPNRN